AIAESHDSHFEFEVRVFDFDQLMKNRRFKFQAAGEGLGLRWTCGDCGVSRVIGWR
ncbi:Hypothetical predicted protein, partial [Olea europaea subsp. europaea]